MRTRFDRARVAFWTVYGVMGFMLVFAALLPSRLTDTGPFLALMMPFALATLFIGPAVFFFLTLGKRINRHRYNHIIECHPLLARIVWQPGLGPRPIGGIYRRRCRRWLCLFRER